MPSSTLATPFSLAKEVRRPVEEDPPYNWVMQSRNERADKQRVVVKETRPQRASERRRSRKRRVN